MRMWSAFSYKGKPVKIRQVAEELGVRYVLEGSVRRAENEVRINAQLIDSISGGQLWAERYDGSLADIFALQDRVTGRIVAALAVKLTADEQQSNVTRSDSVEAHDEFLRGWAKYRQDTPQGFIQAIPYLKRATELDPNYGHAYAALASLFYDGLRRDWELKFGEALPEVPKFPDAWLAVGRIAFEFQDQAMRHPTSLAHGVQSEMYVQNGRHQEAIAEAERAIALAPNDPIGFVKLGNALTMAGRPQEAIDFVRHAMRLDPHYPPSYLWVLGMAYYGVEDYCLRFRQDARRALEARARVLRAGRRIEHAQCEFFAISESEEELVAAALVTVGTTRSVEEVQP